MRGAVSAAAAGLGVGGCVEIQQSIPGVMHR